MAKEMEMVRGTEMVKEMAREKARVKEILENSLEWETGMAKALV
ncbi:MAG: hypothetical protein ABWW65_00050 [Thermoprotei archaeon]